jgi:hypothetical protein
MMTLEESFLGFLVALAAGALIGLERQQDLGFEGKSGMGGVRTFPLIALTGALSAFVSQILGVWPVVATLLILGIILAVSYNREGSRKDHPPCRPYHVSPWRLGLTSRVSPRYPSPLSPYRRKRWSGHGAAVIKRAPPPSCPTSFR